MHDFDDCFHCNDRMVHQVYLIKRYLFPARFTTTANNTIPSSLPFCLLPQTQDKGKRNAPQVEDNSNSEMDLHADAHHDMCGDGGHVST